MRLRANQTDEATLDDKHSGTKVGLCLLISVYQCTIFQISRRTKGGSQPAK